MVSFGVRFQSEIALAGIKNNVFLNHYQLFVETHGSVFEKI